MIVFLNFSFVHNSQLANRNRIANDHYVSRWRKGEFEPDAIATAADVHIDHL